MQIINIRISTRKCLYSQFLVAAAGNNGTCIGPGMPDVVHPFILQLINYVLGVEDASW